MGLFNKAKSYAAETLATRTGTDSLIVTPVWGPDWPNTDVVGESHYGKQIQALLPRRLGQDGAEVFIDVTLVREPKNSHDRHAVAVHAATGTVGYLDRKDAARYASVLDALAANGRVAQTKARVWGGMREAFDSNRTHFVGSVSIALPEPHLMFPANLPPTSPYAQIPAGSAIQVTGEENYRENLAPWLNAHGEVWVHATLHSVDEQSARTTKTVAEVRIDDLPVGRLTPKMSQDMLPAIDYLAQRGLQTCVRAIVKGNALKSDVVLHTARAGELSNDWLTQVEQQGPGLGGGDGSPTAIEAAPAPVQAPGHAPPAGPPPAPLPPANWYPDPYGTTRLRYWDGTQWTGHTAD